MSTCVFGGPTLHGRDHRGLDVLPPARLGSLYRAWQRGYRTFGVVDGYFGSIPSIWHKEILYVISLGGRVFGAASLGALRAAELAPYGMVGIGAIYRACRLGLLTDDDEVCVTHAPRALGYRPLSEAMVNVRVTLRRLRRLGHLDRRQERSLADACKAVHFSRRSRTAVGQCFADVLGTDHAGPWQAYQAHVVDQKGIDADRLLAGLADDTLAVPRTPPFAFPATLHWRRQFDERLAELPAADHDPFDWR